MLCSMAEGLYPSRTARKDKASGQVLWNGSGSSQRKRTAETPLRNGRLIARLGSAVHDSAAKFVSPKYAVIREHDQGAERVLLAYEERVAEHGERPRHQCRRSQGIYEFRSRRENLCHHRTGSPNLSTGCRKAFRRARPENSVRGRTGLGSSG